MMILFIVGVGENEPADAVEYKEEEDKGDVWRDGGGCVAGPRGGGEEHGGSRLPVMWITTVLLMSQTRRNQGRNRNPIEFGSRLRKEAV